MNNEQDEIFATVVPLDEGGCVAARLPCVRCGTNLEGCPFIGACPSCNGPVSDSARADLLHNSPRRYVERLSRGTSLMLLGTSGQILAAFFMLAAALVTGNLRHEITMDNWMTMPMGLLFLLLIVGMKLSIVVGVWWATTLPPSEAEQPHWLDARRIARVCCAAMFVIGSILTFDPAAVREFGNAAQVIWITGFIAVTLHFRSLALRALFPALARHDLVVLWTTVVLSLLAIALNVVNGSSDSATGQPVRIGFFIAHIGLWIWVSVLLYQHFVVLNEVSHAAATNLVARQVEASRYTS